MKPLGAESYVSLATFRRNGEQVLTPVWIAPGPSDDRLYVYTNRTSYKVRRLRNDPRVRLAPCRVDGRVTGPWQDGRGRQLDDPSEVERGFDAVIHKYGWQMRLALLTSRLSGRYADRAILEIRLDPA